MQSHMRVNQKNGEAKRSGMFEKVWKTGKNSYQGLKDCHKIKMESGKKMQWQKPF